jgi:hypothetical protein
MTASMDRDSSSSSASREMSKDMKGAEALEPCAKAHNDETARIGDADDACDDGVR